MTRKIFVFILGFAVLVSAMVWRVDDFESGNFGDITSTDQDGDGSFWQVEPSVKRGGAYIARSESYSKTPDNLLNYPSVYVELDSYLSFWVGAESGTDFAETYQIFIDFNGPCDTSTSQVIWQETLTSADWKNVEIDLKPIILAYDEWAFEANIYVGIRHFGSSNQSALLIDDVMFKSIPIFFYDDPWSFEIPAEVVEPFEDVSMRFYVYDRTIYDAEWNFIGYNNIDLHYIITDGSGTQPEQSLPLVLNTDPDYLETYTATIPGKQMGTKMQYWVEATDNSLSGLVGKSNIFNVLWGEINFSEGFENTGEINPETGLPPGWEAFQTGTILNPTFDYSWVVGTTSKQNVHTGAYSIRSESQSNWGVWESYNYLVSPRVRINGKPTLKYFMNAQTLAGEEYKERWSVFVSTAEGVIDTSTFVELQTDSIIPTTENLESWFEKIIYLGDYQDQYVRIIWKNKYTSTQTKLDRFLNLDDISIAEMPVIVNNTGNAAVPGEEIEINVTATDFSGINNVKLYYTLQGQSETSVVMTDNGDNTYSYIIPAQTLDTRCSWYAEATDDSEFLNSTRTPVYQVIWFNSGVLEWGSDYSDWPEMLNAGNKAAMDWNFGLEKGNLYLNKIEVGWAYDAVNMPWKVVEFDGAPTENVIGDLQGVNSFSAGGDSLILGSNTKLSGHVALVFDVNNYNELMLDESGDKSHAWQWNSVSQWETNLWGAFYIRMYVSQLPNGIEDEFVSSTTELCQNYPNPFNPETSISFYNRIAGKVSLTIFNTKGEEVTVLMNEHIGEGFRKINFNASGINSGVYYYTLKTPEKTLTRKMVLVK